MCITILLVDLIDAQYVVVGDVAYEVVGIGGGERMDIAYAYDGQTRLSCALSLDCGDHVPRGVLERRLDYQVGAHADRGAQQADPHGSERPIVGAKRIGQRVHVDRLRSFVDGRVCREHVSMSIRCDAVIALVADILGREDDQQLGHFDKAEQAHAEKQVQVAAEHAEELLAAHLGLLLRPRVGERFVVHRQLHHVARKVAEIAHHHVEQLPAALHTRHRCAAHDRVILTPEDTAQHAHVVVLVNGLAAVVDAGGGREHRASALERTQLAAAGVQPLDGLPHFGLGAVDLVVERARVHVRHLVGEATRVAAALLRCAHFDI